MPPAWRESTGAQARCVYGMRRGPLSPGGHGLHPLTAIVLPVSRESGDVRLRLGSDFFNTWCVWPQCWLSEVGEADFEAPGNKRVSPRVREEDPCLSPSLQSWCCFTFPAAVTSCFPLQTFFPETTDIYDKKNMPRVVYCIHALR